MRVLYAKFDYNARRKLIVHQSISTQAFPGTVRFEVFEAFRKEMDR